MTSVSYADACGPDGTVVYAIGDVHGRLDLLTAMHETIREETERRKADWRIVHLGDYIDRGPDSAGVLDLLARRSIDERVVCLVGNHDAGFLDFLSSPTPESLFARYGGVQTAQSYGVGLAIFDPVAFRLSCRALDRSVPAHHREFLKGLKTSIAFGDFFFCHAGIRPGVPLSEQEARDLMWIRGDFHHHDGLFEKVIVHGHTPVAEAEILSNRVNVDTGAYASNRLTALVIDGAQKRLITVGK